LVFTGDEFADGGNMIAETLKAEKIKASFFLTGNFYRNPSFKKTIQQLKKDGHYMGAHSDKHLLYCDWGKRDSLLVSKKQFTQDLNHNYVEMAKFGISKTAAPYFLPPYEWFNDSVALWTKELGLQLINFTPGTRSNTDYTFPGPSNYKSSDTIYQSIINYEKNHTAGLNGFILLLHIGTDSRRTDKFYTRLAELVTFLHQENYQFVTIKGLLTN
jgi:endoglucanase